ncbi:MAG: glycosyltransferase family 4 protein, partial [Anaerolineae bacterium]|nr:glycosyltransferase family 4 protein [Anaerolineae bacterium]
MGSSLALEARFQAAGFQYYTYPLSRRINPLADIQAILYVWRLCRELRPDIVHTFDTKPSIFGRIGAVLARVPVVIGTLPGLGALYTDGYTARSIKRLVVKAAYEWMQMIVSRLSTATIFQNDDDFKQLTRRGLVPLEKARVIASSGVNTQQFHPGVVSDAVRAALRDEIAVAPDTIVFTMVSRLLRSKGVCEYAEAAKRVKAQHPHVRFLLVGAEDTDSLDRLTSAEVKSIAQNVTWLGFRRDIPAVLAISDGFVLPSYYREGTPRVLLEAAAMGQPIVTTHMPGCREVVREGENGFLVPIRDPSALAHAITRLIEDADLRADFARRSRQIAVKRFDLERVAQ